MINHVITFMNWLRLLPVLIVCTVALLGFKLINVWDGVAGIGVDKAMAQPQAETRPEKSTAPEAAENTVTPAQPAPSASAERSNDISSMSESEVALLQRLSERREILNTRENQLKTRENLLIAAGKRVEERIARLTEIESRIAKLIDIFDAQENARIGKLVQVYQNMKAKDAAAIFDQLDMEVLLAVAQRMEDAKMAEVLGKMKADAAKRLTVEMARQKKLPETAS